MPAIGTTQNSWIPSPAQLLSAAPKALVGVLAVLSGIANARGAPHVSSGQTGGGLTSEAHDIWVNNGLPQMQACLSKPTAYRFDPDRVVDDCLLQNLSTRTKRSKDQFAAEVVSRGVRRYELNKPLPDQREGSKPDALKSVLNDAARTVRNSDKYEEIMVAADIYFGVLTTTRNSHDPEPPYTASALKQHLNNAAKLDSFRERAHPLSFSYNDMVSKELQNINVLQPERMPSLTDLAN